LENSPANGDADSPLIGEPSASPEPNLTSHQSAWLLISVLIVALCGITYELIIAAVSSYLLGNSIAQFSITIGLFMFAMGIGSYLTKFIRNRLVERFIQIEIAVAFIGGLSAAILFLIFPYFALYSTTMYGLILMIGTLVGLEIPLLTRILSRSASFSDSLAHVLSLDYLGALIGSVGFPLLLLPSLGLFRAAFAIGLLNITVAVVALTMLGKSNPHLRKLWIHALFVVVVLCIGLLASSWFTRFAEGQLFANEIIYREQSTYQRIVLTNDMRNQEVRLYLDGHLQFAAHDEHRYHESLVHPVMSYAPPSKRILILGGGDGLAAREVLKFPDVESIELVDIDDRVTALAKQLAPIRRLNGDSLLDARVQLIHTDAFNYVQQIYPQVVASGKAYDRIIIDLPDPHSEVLNKLYSKEFYGLLRRVLHPDGAMVTQSGSPVITREAFWCIAQTIEAAGFSVLSYRAHLNSFGEWGFHLATPNANALDGQPLQLASVPRRHLNDALFQSMQTFALDTERIPSPINSIFEPKLYLLYEAGLKR
jgi:spermidine synthase